MAAGPHHILQLIHLCKDYYYILIQVRLMTEVPSTPSSTRLGFKLMTSRSCQYISCHWDTCSNHSAISDFLLFCFRHITTVRREHKLMVTHSVDRCRSFRTSLWSHWSPCLCASQWWWGTRWFQHPSGISSCRIPDNTSLPSYQWSHQHLQRKTHGSCIGFKDICEKKDDVWGATWSTGCCIRDCHDVYNRLACTHRWMALQRANWASGPISGPQTQKQIFNPGIILIPKKVIHGIIHAEQL